MKPETKAKVDAALDKVLDTFLTGKIGEVIALSYWPAPDIPSAKWSLRNRILMAVEDTIDARGYRQWQAAGRQVKKGSRSFCILGPSLVKVKKDNGNGEDQDEETTDELRLVGFHGINVFRVEDTDGEKLDYEIPEVPELPFRHVADRLGLSVKAGFGNGDRFGSYSPGRKLIRLNSPEPIVFFHELAHAAHAKIGTLKNVPKAEREAVAELGAAVLGLMAGYEWDDMSGHCYEYVKSHANGKNPGAMAYQVLGTLEKVLDVVLN